MDMADVMEQRYEEAIMRGEAAIDRCGDRFSAVIAAARNAGLDDMDIQDVFTSALAQSSNAPEVDQSSNVPKSDQMKDTIEVLSDAVECGAAMCDTPIGRRKLGLDAGDERLQILRRGVGLVRAMQANG